MDFGNQISKGPSVYTTECTGIQREAVGKWNQGTTENKSHDYLMYGQSLDSFKQNFILESAYPVWNSYDLVIILKIPGHRSSYKDLGVKNVVQSRQSFCNANTYVSGKL